ncbi:MAG: hypothetical protein FJ280_27930 [Planctomycetes bacterium]|nr:hypothetical protein [Planctomycetota bacterium]
MANEIQTDYASGSTLYAVIRNRAGQVWHPGQQGFETWGTNGRTAADYACALTDKAGSRYVGDFDAGIPAGDYGIQVFRQAGATPADTDPLVGSRAILWTGTGELTAAKILANRAVQDPTTSTIDYYDDDGQTLLLSHVLHDEGATFTRMIDNG